MENSAVRRPAVGCIAWLDDFVRCDRKDPSLIRRDPIMIEATLRVEPNKEPLRINLEVAAALGTKNVNQVPLRVFEVWRHERRSK